MPVEAFRVQNFMGFEDSGWIELRPITLLFGRNSSGKSAILRALLLLRQSLDSPTPIEPLCFVRDGALDYGDYGELVRGHRSTRQLSFLFECRLEDTAFPDARNALKDLGPVVDIMRVRLTYSWLPDSSTVVLSGVALTLKDDRVLLRASRQRNAATGDPWPFESQFFSLKEGEPEQDIWPYLQMQSIGGFLPTIRSVEGQLLLEDETDPNQARGFGDTFHRVWNLIRAARITIRDFLGSLSYLGPLRSEPERFYYVLGRTAIQTPQDQNVVRCLLDETSPLLDQVNEWLEKSEFRIQISLNPLDRKRRLYELRIVDVQDPVTRPLYANVREVGFGIPQVLPVVIQAILAPEGSTIIVEQPELHLHPGAQAELGDLFVMAAHHGVSCLVETHSEHLLLRLRRRIAETSAGMASSDSRRDLHCSNVNFSFVQRTKGLSRISRIPIDDLGNMGPLPDKRFFSNDFEEVSHLTEAAMLARKASMEKVS